MQIYTETGLKLSSRRVMCSLQSKSLNRYHSLAPMYYRGAAVAIVVYDITDMVTQCVSYQLYVYNDIV